MQYFSVVLLKSTAIISVGISNFVTRWLIFQVDVFFTSLTYENIEETPAMTVASLMSNLGGALSLYLGVSFVAAFEIIELIVRLIVAPFCRNK